MDSVEQTHEVILTPAAAQMVQDLFQQKNLQGYALRVFIQGGGCSGYQYGLALDNNIRTTDLIFEMHGVQVVVDEMSIIYLDGATIDHVNEATGSGFKITNPNPLPGCGCGSSSRNFTESSCGNGGCGCH